jgi:hypothetical protein
MKHCAPAIRDSGGGSIINISSTAGLTAHDDAAYTASKWGLRGLTKTAVLQFSQWNIRVHVKDIIPSRRGPQSHRRTRAREVPEQAEPLTVPAPKGDTVGSTRRCTVSGLRFSPMGTRIRFLGWYRPGIGHPLFFLPGTSMRATSSATLRGPGPASLLERWEKETIHRLRSPFLEGHGGVFYGPVGVRDGRETGHARVHENGKLRA